MKQTLILSLVILSLALPVMAQKKRPTSTAKAKPKVAAAPAPATITTETTEALNTFKGLTKFIYLYGKISNGLELADEQARKTRLPASVIEQNTNNKNAVIRSIAAQKDQVDKLGKLFEANPRLQVQNINLAGVTQKISEAMDLVSSNRYDEGGRSLLMASERFLEVVQSMK